MTTQEPVLDWARLRKLMDSDGRPPAWRTAGLWALDVLADEMGVDWPIRYMAKQGRLPDELSLATYLPAAFAGLLELVLRLRVLKAVAGIAPVRKDLAEDLREERMQHSAIQLEVASLGLRSGFDVAMEARLSRVGNPVDVRLRFPSATIGVETFAVLKDEGTRDAERYIHELRMRLDEICWPLGVDIDGALEVRLDGDDTDRWLGEIESAARTAVATRRPQLVDWPSAAVTVVPAGAVQRTSFTGPMERGAGWPRLVSILQTKARQAARSGARWLRVDVKDGMFQLTDWSQMDLQRKLSVLADHLPGALDGADWLAGVVITSGACQVAGEIDEAQAEDPHGGHALRRRLALGRARETFIVPLRAVDVVTGALWFDLYDREALWLDRELVVAGLPTVGEMLSR